MHTSKQVIIAALLISIALSATAYATLTLSSVTVNIDDVKVEFNTNKISGIHVPHRAVFEREFTNGLKITGLGNLKSGDVLTIRVELIADSYLAGAVRNIVVKVNKGSSNKGILTLNKPWADFTYTLTDTDVTSGKVYFDIQVIVAAGDRAISSASLTLTGSVVGVNGVSV